MHRMPYFERGWREERNYIHRVQYIILGYFKEVFIVLKVHAPREMHLIGCQIISDCDAIKTKNAKR